MSDDLDDANFISGGRSGLLLRPDMLFSAGRTKDGVTEVEACEKLRILRFIGRLIGRALREGYRVPLQLSEAFFLQLQNKAPMSDWTSRRNLELLPGKGNDGWEGRIVGASYAYALDRLEAGWSLKSTTCLPSDDAGWSLKYLNKPGSYGAMYSFEEAVVAGGVCFTTYGTHGEELIENGEDLDVVVDKNKNNGTGAAVAVDANKNKAARSSSSKSQTVSSSSSSASASATEQDNLDQWCKEVHRKWVLDVQPLY